MSRSATVTVKIPKYKVDNETEFMTLVNDVGRQLTEMDDESNAFEIEETTHMVPRNSDAGTGGQNYTVIVLELRCTSVTNSALKNIFNYITSQHTSPDACPIRVNTDEADGPDYIG